MKTKNTKLLNEDKNREYYSKSDGHFMPLESSLYAHRVLDRVAWVRDKVLELDSKYHLDIGCKDGYTCLTLTADGLDCVGVDPSTDAIDEAKLKAREADLEVTYIVGFLEDVKPEFYFDTVSLMEVLEHVIDADKALEKLTTLGRYVLITTPDVNGRHGLLDSERNEEHVRLFSLDELVELCTKYGRVMESVIRDDQLCILLESKNG